MNKVKERARKAIIVCLFTRSSAWWLTIVRFVYRYSPRGGDVKCDGVVILREAPELVTRHVKILFDRLCNVQGHSPVAIALCWGGSRSVYNIYIPRGATLTESFSIDAKRVPHKRFCPFNNKREKKKKNNNSLNFVNETCNVIISTFKLLL